MVESRFRLLNCMSAARAIRMTFTVELLNRSGALLGLVRARWSGRFWRLRMTQRNVKIQVIGVIRRMIRGPRLEIGPVHHPS